MKSDSSDLGPRKKFVKVLVGKIIKQVVISEAPVSLKQIIEYVQKTHDLVVTRIDIGESVSGLLVVCNKIDGEYVTIGFNGNHAWCRRRFTIAHELGHLLLGHGCNQTENDDFHNEKEANLFAAELLMPVELIKKDFIKFPNVEDLARLYRVSGQAISIRLMSLGLV